MVSVPESTGGVGQVYATDKGQEKMAGRQLMMIYLTRVTPSLSPVFISSPTSVDPWLLMKNRKGSVLGVRLNVTASRKSRNRLREDNNR
jgi:hypothetical protein